MNEKDFIRLKHMLDSSLAIREYLYKKDRKSLDEERLLYSAVVRELEIIGEAANSVSEDTQNLCPSLPWKQMVGMRNRLIHGYFTIDKDIVWQTVLDSIPKLINELESICSEE